MSTEKETLEFDLFFAGFLLQLNSYQRYLRSVHLFNGDYLSIPEGTGSCEHLFQDIPGTLTLIDPGEWGLYYSPPPQL